jgi:hypothetical protein
MWAEASKAIETGLPKSFGAHVMSLWVPAARQGATGVNAYPSGLQYGFGPILAVFLFLPFGITMCSLSYHCILEVYNLLFDFIVAKSLL